jgi:hypothetical protein
MRQSSTMLAAAIMSGFVLMAASGEASPLAGISAAAHVPQVGQGFVEKVHGWHCKRQLSKRLGWHRHRGACSVKSTNHAARGYIPGHVLTPYGYADCIGWWERHDDGRMQCHGQLIRER